MQQDVNLIIENFKQSIFDLANQSGLPLSVVYYVLGDTYRQVENEYTAYLSEAKTRERARAEALAQEQALAKTENNNEEIIEDNED